MNKSFKNKILFLLITCTFSLCAIAVSEEESKADSKPETEVEKAVTEQEIIKRARGL